MKTFLLILLVSGAAIAEETAWNVTSYQLDFRHRRTASDSIEVAWSVINPAKAQRKNELAVQRHLTESAVAAAALGAKTLNVVSNGGR